ncbi:hypothetical protein SALBM135S_05807 [Streptomyces alboniger]
MALWQSGPGRPAWPFAVGLVIYFGYSYRKSELAKVERSGGA